MANKDKSNIKVMQLNVCGSSQASIHALNQYINTNKSHFVFLSETKSVTLNDKDFDNYQVYMRPNRTTQLKKEELQFWYTTTYCPKETTQ